MIDYSPLDQPSILRFIFYPRRISPRARAMALTSPSRLEARPRSHAVFTGSSGMALDPFLPRKR